MRDEYKRTLAVGTDSFDYFALDVLTRRIPQAERLPYSLKILLENLLRNEDGSSVRSEDIEALATLDPSAPVQREISFRPARVLLQDFTGVPALVDLAAMRDAMQRMGGDPKLINPLLPVELVVDHSVQVDEYGTDVALSHNAAIESERNAERYQFLKWGQEAFKNFRVVPPDMGIVHQVNLEYLARVVMRSDEILTPDGRVTVYPDTLVGTDSHTTMINGLGVLGWGCGGIEAEAAMLGQPVSMLIPEVIGVRLIRSLPEGSTATDLVLAVTEMLRKRGVVGKFVEFFGAGLATVPLADRATIANMSPEYGATCGIFPVDDETLRYLRFTGRSKAQVQLVEAYMKRQGLFHSRGVPEATYTDVLELDLGTIEPSIAGPTRPQDRVALSQAKQSFQGSLEQFLQQVSPKATVRDVARLQGEGGGGAAIGTRAAQHAVVRDNPERIDAGSLEQLTHGSVVIAAITSCTNTSNPSVLMAAGLLAKKAVERGLSTPTWVKTSLAPGSQVVTDYLKKADLLSYLEKLRFHLVGYGCTTCIGNSGPLLEPISKAIEERQLVACAVLSGNRNFEGRIHPEVRANYLMSPPLVVAYALAGRMDIDLVAEPLGVGDDGHPVFLRDIWPSRHEVAKMVEDHIHSEMFRAVYSRVFEGDEHWKAMKVPEGDLFGWQESSSYVKLPPYFADLAEEPAPIEDVRDARVLVMLGDSVTTDHISPAGAIKKASPAGELLSSLGIAAGDFNSYGARRGNHEVMMRGTFANVRLRNRLAEGTEGGVTRYLGAGPHSGKVISIFDAAQEYQEEGVPLVILAGKEYGSGSSRDWAAKGPHLLGVRAVIAESFERIHRSNLVGMGILPLEFASSGGASVLGLTGEERFEISDVAATLSHPTNGERKLSVRARTADGDVREFSTRVRIDTPQELLYFEHGGILPYVLRSLLKEA